MSNMRVNLSIFFLLFSVLLYAQDLAILKYKGGGDWYSNPTAVPNLIEYCKGSTYVTNRGKLGENFSVR